MTSTDYMCQEKKEEEDFAAFKTVLRYHYYDYEKYIQKRGERSITAT